MDFGLQCGLSIGHPQSMFQINLALLSNHQRSRVRAKPTDGYIDIGGNISSATAVAEAAWVNSQTFTFKTNI